MPNGRWLKEQQFGYDYRGRLESHGVMADILVGGVSSGGPIWINLDLIINETVIEEKFLEFEIQRSYANDDELFEAAEACVVPAILAIAHQMECFVASFCSDQTNTDLERTIRQ